MLTNLTFGLALLAAIIIPRVLGMLELEIVAFVLIGASSVYSGFLPLWAGIIIAVVPIITNLFMWVYFIWLGRRALDGDFGEAQMWMAEYVRDGDPVFISALDQLSEMDKKEIILIADSKQELKELAMERADEPVGD